MKHLLRSSFLAVFALTSPVFAQSGLDNVVQVDIVPGWDANDGNVRMAGLRIKMAPGWKTYWRAPGDAGIPPQFDWSGSRNLAGVHVHWPTPKVFHQSGMRSIGYDNTVVLPLSLSPDTTGKDITLKGDIEIGICADICIPYAVTVSGTVPHGVSTRDGQIAASIAQAPYSAKEAGVTSATCSITPLSDGVSLTATLEMPSTGGAEVAVIEAGNAHIWTSEPTLKRRGQTVTAIADMMHVSGDAFALDRSAVVITILGRKHAVEIKGCTAG
jgi:DsbC/DsbD-like thiol-disulfide interchange protein